MDEFNPYEIAGNKIKLKYQNLEWNQHEPQWDIFNDIEQVENLCGTFGNSVENSACWLDAFNWSVMNKSTITEDIYQFISHRARVVRGGVDKEIENFHFNNEVFEPIQTAILTQFKKGIINLIDWII